MLHPCLPRCAAGPSIAATGGGEILRSARACFFCVGGLRIALFLGCRRRCRFNAESGFGYLLSSFFYLSGWLTGCRPTRRGGRIVIVLHQSHHEPPTIWVMASSKNACINAAPLSSCKENGFRRNEMVISLISRKRLEACMRAWKGERQSRSRSDRRMTSPPQASGRQFSKPLPSLYRVMGQKDRAKRWRCFEGRKQRSVGVALPFPLEIRGVVFISCRASLEKRAVPM
ncbi:hypothetical protein BKA81DRAFT_16449 [Phyllosticta paracitricarpa]|uniref:Uncharacterized protein n=2 Tax=Phyllosticta TaxID=121621 RepID=A0ABR1MDX6_9PEZI